MTPRRIVLALWDGGGVVPPLMQVARRLTVRGHAVRVIADPTIEAEARTAGCEFGPWTRAPHRTTRDREADIIRDYAARSRKEHLEQGLGAYFFKPGLEWTADVLAAIDEHQADVVLTDLMVPWGVLAAEIRRLPSAALHTMPYMVPTPGMTPTGAALLPVPRMLSGPRNLALRRLIEWVLDRFTADVNRVRLAHGLPPVAHTFDQIRRATAQIVLTSRAFDYHGAGAPPMVHWTGPQLDDPLWCEAWNSPWPAGDSRPLVLVGLSSTYQAQIPLLNRLIDALATLPARALVTVGPPIREGEVQGRDNVVVVRSAPHAAVLREAAVLVTHAGHGTTMKGLSAGVPMVCLPMGRDQDDNAARVAASGAGIRLSPTASTDQLRHAVSKVLGTASFREAARRMARAIARREGERDVVDLVESLLGSQARTSDAAQAIA